MSRTTIIPDTEWITLGEASEYLGVAQGTIRRWADAGALPVFRTPGKHRRFKREDLDAFLHRGDEGADTPTGHQGGAAHVLVVDDDAAVREMLCELLRADGYSVQEAPSARDALLAINSRIPDLLLLDVKMPGMDGWTMLQKIRDNPVVGDLPVIIFSGAVSEDELRGGAGGGRGAQGYMRKPFDPRKLVEQAKALLVAEQAVA